MKIRVIALISAFALLLASLCGCVPVAGTSPAEVENVKWVTPDYSFRFNTADDCRGNYTYNGTKYNIQAAFEGGRITVTDLDKNQELFSGDWKYEDTDYLFVYNIVYNTADYGELENNFSEFYRLNQEALS